MQPIYLRLMRRLTSFAAHAWVEIMMQNAVLVQNTFQKPFPTTYQTNFFRCICIIQRRARKHSVLVNCN